MKNTYLKLVVDFLFLLAMAAWCTGFNGVLPEHKIAHCKSTFFNCFATSEQFLNILVMY